jgi:hypothetical protein
MAGQQSPTHPGVALDAPARMLSIGTAGGVISGFAELADGGGLVRLGDSLQWVDPEQYRLWDAGLLAPTRSALLEWAARVGISGAEGLLRALVADRLMVEHARDPAGMRRQAVAHSVRFIGYIVGNGSGRSPRFLIKAAAETSAVLVVDVALYHFLLWADGTTSMAEQCARHALDGLPDGIDAVRHVAGQLPILMRAGVISLDPVITAGQSRLS